MYKNRQNTKFWRNFGACWATIVAGNTLISRDALLNPARKNLEGAKNGIGFAIARSHVSRLRGQPGRGKFRDNGMGGREKIMTMSV